MALVDATIRRIAAEHFVITSSGLSTLFYEASGLVVLDSAPADVHVGDLLRHTRCVSSFTPSSVAAFAALAAALHTSALLRPPSSKVSPSCHHLSWRPEGQYFRRLKSDVITGLMMSGSADPSSVALLLRRVRTPHCTMIICTLFRFCLCHSLLSFPSKPNDPQRDRGKRSYLAIMLTVDRTRWGVATSRTRGGRDETPMRVQ